MELAVTTVIVDRSALFREGLQLILKDTPFRAARTGASIDQVQAKLPRSRKVLLLICAEGESQDTAQQIRRFKEQSPDARVVVLASTCAPNEVRSLFQAGASGFFLKDISREALIKSLDLVMLGQTMLPAGVVALMDNARDRDAEDRPAGEAPPVCDPAVEPGRHRLSDRESEILKCLMEGEPNKLIARKFDIAEATVKVHIKAILRKISAKNRTQAAIWAHHNLGNAPPPRGFAVAGERQSAGNVVDFAPVGERA
ncbi:MAG: response regulator transcription factor [Alphaproteobacteria bacterium]|nr:response regulator transcription factor [Alphaproteobacteria bacterium]